MAILVVMVAWTLPQRAVRAEGDKPALSVTRPLPLEPEHEWRSINHLYWQVVSEQYEDPALTDQIEQNRGQCPTGMIEIEGRMKRDPSPILYAWARIERMQLDACVDFISRAWPFRCREFDRSKWLELSRDLKTRPMHYCIDRFEYPNVRGQYPIVGVTWHEAERVCKQGGKRLCSEDEWTFACEGEEALPFPNGYVRGTDVCVVDRELHSVRFGALYPRDGKSAMRAMDELWQGEPSGSHPGCRSPFGVYDMTGNVDEWSRTVHEGHGYSSILKGGYWGPNQNRCRASTRAHYEDYLYYQEGFRCCAEIKGQLAEP